MPKIYVKKEARKRNMRFRVAAGFADFAGIVLSIVLAIVCLILLRALFVWMIDEGIGDFSRLWNLFTSALIIPK